MEEAARVSVQLSNGETPQFTTAIQSDINIKFADNQDGVKGYYSGGTLASEAAMLLKDTLGDNSDAETPEGFSYKGGHHEIIDLGDDIYTQGRPHPMIDPSKRIEMLEQSADDPSTAIIMLDNVIGYGSHDDMANELAPTIQKVLDKAQSEGRSLAVLATVVGTEHDHQGYDKQVNILKEAGAIVCETNNQMVTTALHLLGKDVEQPQLETKSFEAESVDLTVDEKVLNLINMKPSVINIGLKSFTEAIQANDAQVVQFNWQPIAGGDEKLMKVLQFLNNYEGETV